MSVCDPCTKTELVPKCLTNLVIGTIGSNGAAVYVYIHDLTTDKLTRFSEVSSGAGLVTLTDLDDEPDFMPSHSYELWITLQSATSIEDRENIDIGGTNYTCLALRFEDVGEAYNSITLAIAS